MSCHVLVSTPRQTLTPSGDIKNSNPQGSTRSLVDLLGFRSPFSDVVHFEVVMLGRCHLDGNRAGAGPLAHKALVVGQGKVMGMAANHGQCLSQLEPQVQWTAGSQWRLVCLRYPACLWITPHQTGGRELVKPSGFLASMYVNGPRHSEDCRRGDEMDANPLEQGAENCPPPPLSLSPPSPLLPYLTAEEETSGL